VVSCNAVVNATAPGSTGINTFFELLNLRTSNFKSLILFNMAGSLYTCVNGGGGGSGGGDCDAGTDFDFGN
jgi:hypothetical protein